MLFSFTVILRCVLSLFGVSDASVGVGVQRFNIGSDGSFQAVQDRVMEYSLNSFDDRNQNYVISSNGNTEQKYVVGNESDSKNVVKTQKKRETTERRYVVNRENNGGGRLRAGGHRKSSGDDWMAEKNPALEKHKMEQKQRSVERITRNTWSLESFSIPIAACGFLFIFCFERTWPI